MKRSSFFESTGCGTARRCDGFTLIELLAVLAIVGVLTAIIVPSLSAARTAAYKSREIVAAKSLMQAYSLWSQEHRNRLAPSFRDRLSAADVAAGRYEKVTDEQGNELDPNGDPARRWATHMRPLLGDRYKTTLYVNRQADFYDEFTGNTNADYLTNMITAYTTFGMNATYVGDFTNTSSAQPVRNYHQASNPSKLIVFVSAYKPAYSNSPYSGWFRVEPPSLWSVSSARDYENDVAALADTQPQGYVAYRYGGKAVVAFLDGHVELKSFDELKDMRQWSNTAYEQNNPNFSPGYIE